MSGLAQGVARVPQTLAARAVTDAFVRRSRGGRLLPCLGLSGEPELDERSCGSLEPLRGEPVPPAIDPMERMMLLARLVQTHGGVDAAEAFRLAQDLARTLDKLLVEQVDPSRLGEIVADIPDISLH